MDEILTRLGTRIRELRTKKGLSQSRLAELAGINDKYLGEVERGTNNISVRKLTQIAEAIGVEVQELFDSAHLADRETLVSDLRGIIDSASDDQLQTIYRVVLDVVR